jgi:6-phosphogluconate dehydrogenase
MKKQLTINILGYEFTFQIRNNRKSRFDDIVINHKQKQQMIDEIDIDSLKAKIQAMRLVHNKD